ncbi:MAG: hypothetical protein JO016_16180 [Actinobacteria bacterium]|nr:hypothetical protein [Actinomycetota bacterium]
MTTDVTRRSFLAGGGAVAGVALVGVRGQSGGGAGEITVAAGQTRTITATTRVTAVTIEPGGVLTAPAGHSLTMTVNGVETGQRLAATDGAATVFVPGHWRGDIALTVTKVDDVPWQQHTYPFRQAVYAGPAGVVPAYSVLAAAGGHSTGTRASGLAITSTGECFNGVYVSDGPFTLDRPVISLTGNGRCDFVGYGAAVVGTGKSARLVLDGARIRTHGVVRTAVVADGGATVVVKNSSLAARNGVLPAGYVPTVNLDTMQSAPWMLAIDGNVRATNLLGEGTIAAYVNSSVVSETWGALSTDAGSGCTLAAINSHVANTGDSGYGTYVIGDATEYLLGTEFDVGSYATIFTGGTATYGDSDRATVAALSERLGLGLTAAELRALKPRPTIVNSRRFGFMWHDQGTLAITGGTQINSAHATFLNKGQPIKVSVDGTDGARLNPADGVLVQVIDNDDPGPVMVNGQLENAGVYTQPAGEPARDRSFDVSVAHSTDSVLSFTGIALRGDFYNGMRGRLNLVLGFTASRIEGVISATLAEHLVDTIDAANWWQLGAVTNTVQPAINNGVLVSLAGGARWTVTGTCHLTRLTLDATSAVAAPAGRRLRLTVNGAATALEPGHTYTGALVLTLT